MPTMRATPADRWRKLQNSSDPARAALRQPAMGDLCKASRPFGPDFRRVPIKNGFPRLSRSGCIARECALLI